jgi:hypothetical protein
MPAAAIRVVVPSLAVIFGSAPCSRKKRIIGASAALAASRKAVAPILFIQLR